MASHTEQQKNGLVFAPVSYRVAKDRLLKLVESGKTIFDIAATLGCCKNTVVKLVKSHGISTPNGFYSRKQRLSKETKLEECIEQFDLSDKGSSARQMRNKKRRSRWKRKPKNDARPNDGLPLSGPRDGRVVLVCCDCSRIATVFRSQVYGKTPRYKLVNGVYRCRECWNAIRRGLQIIPKNRKTIKCVDCGRQKEVRSSAASRAPVDYRCRACYEHRRSEIAQIKRSVRCIRCGNTRVLKSRRGSKTGLCIKCAHKRQKTTVIVTCCLCKTEILVTTAEAKRRKARNKSGIYCWTCWRKRRPLGSKNPSFRFGKVPSTYSPDWTASLRAAIRKRDNYKCCVCGWSGPRYKLSIHHVDYDKRNHNPLNLISLCKSCHAKTNFNRTSWKAFLQAIMRRKMRSWSMPHKN